MEVFVLIVILASVGCSVDSVAITEELIIDVSLGTVYEAVQDLTNKIVQVREEISSSKSEILDELSSECESTDDEPVCTTRVGHLSNVGDDNFSEVSCLADEVMTGCSSYLPGTAHGTRDGELVRYSSDGRPTCVAYNGHEGTGVRPYARCCKWKGMVCYYPKSQLSGSGDDDIAKSVCDAWFNGNPTTPTGCMVHTYYQCMDGSRPSSLFSQDMTSEQRPLTERACLAQNGYNCPGVTSYAACCSAPNLQCQVKYSARSGVEANDKANVRCDSGWILTGCNVFTYWLNTDGAYIEDNVCIAVTGGGGVSVWAVATCCRGN
ncbi:proprotein convertase subtilisin/kexin type 9-like [Ptychodera flava]|uniref:proprotein convertase subtilisin/kexin type 9-like n=1 Tax=Ptychodera flava TaxID=63121 RepID=UPI003969BBE6